MYIQVILNSLYVGHVFHAYLNALYNAKKNEWAIITHEEYIESPLNYENLFFEVFDEACVITEEDRIKISQLGITKKFYEKKEQKSGSRTKAMMSLMSDRDLSFEKYVEKFLNNLVQADISKIDGFIVFGEGYESIKYIAQKYNCVVINWELSTFRKVNKFPINLMYGNTNGHLYGTNEAEIRYHKFANECTDVSFLTRKELIAIFGKISTMHLLPLLEYDKYKYQLGICETAAKVIPQTFYRENYTDDDILYRAVQTYRENEIGVREHPAYASVNLSKTVSIPTDPILFILSCKRIAAMSSNMLLEAMLWNRVACTECTSLAYSFACEKDFGSANLVSEKFLNFLIIGYFVPNQRYLFSTEYWNWRRHNPDEKTIFLKHLDIIFTELGIDSSIMKLEEDERFAKILEARGFTQYEIETFNKDISGRNIDYNVLTSVLGCKSNNESEEKKVYCLNEIIDGKVISKFVIDKNYSELNFYPYYNTPGIVRINKIVVNENIIVENNEFYRLIGMYWKEKIVSNLDRDLNEILIQWEYQEFNLFNIEYIVQYYKEISQSYYQQLVHYKEISENYYQQLEQIYQSKSWRITKPLRVIGGFCNSKNMES